MCERFGSSSEYAFHPASLVTHQTSKEQRLGRITKDSRDHIVEFSTKEQVEELAPRIK